jgi:deazaflavin-dependent oxidoreductase (nitroreductase family)
MAQGTVAGRLARVAKKQTVRLTHHGRKSGKPYEVTIWFLVDERRDASGDGDGETLYLVTMNMNRQWTRNVQVRPDVALKIGSEQFSGKVTLVSDPAEKVKVLSLVKRKYWFVRPFLRFKGPDGAFRVDLER